MTEALLRAAIQGSLLAVVAWGTSRILPARAKTRCWIWWIVLAQFAFGWVAVAPIRFGAPAGLAESPFARALVPGAGFSSVPTGTGEGRAVPWLLLIWLAGVAIVAGSHLLGTARWLRLRRRAIPAPEPVQALARRIAAEMGLSAPPAVRLSDALGSPAAFGLFRPAVLLPDRPGVLNEEDLTMVLTHEIAHLARRDPLFAPVPEIATALFWFYPPVHLARREWTIQRELACDEEVYERTACPTKSYRRLLLKVVQADGGTQPRGAFGATADFHCLRRRLLAERPQSHGRLGGTLAVALLATLSFPVALQAPIREPGLLANAGLERGEFAPDDWKRGIALDGVDYRWNDGVAHTGTKSISIRKRVDRYFPIAEWTQAIPYDGRSPAVEFSGWVKAEKVYKAVLDVQFATEEGLSTHQWVAFVGAAKLGDPPVTHDWKQLGGSVKVPPGTKTIYLALQVYGPGQVWLDDVSARFVHRASTPDVNPR